jgi:hypothetical protein
VKLRDILASSARRFDTEARWSIMSAMSTRLIMAAAVAAMLQPMTVVALVRFQRTYGGSGDDRGWSVQQTSDGGYILAGFTSSYGAGLYDIYLIRTDARGDTIWTRTYGDFGSDYAYSVVQTADGGFAVAASIRRAGIDSACVLKTDPQGIIQWQRDYGGILYSIQRTTDGGFCLVGQNQNDVYVVRTSETGDTLWTRTFGDTAEDRGYGLTQTPDGGFVITGWTFSFGDGSGDVYLIRTDSHGDSLWTRTYGGGETEYGASIEVTSDSGYIVAGSTESFGTPGTYGIYIIRTTADGDTLWTRALGGPLFSEGMSVVRTTDDGCVVAGCTESYGAGGSDVYLIGANPSGDTVWTRTFGGIDDDGAFSIQRTTDGGYVIAGQKGPDRSGDVYLIKTDASGSLGVTEEPPTPQAVRRELVANVVGTLAQGAVAFDAMGRRMLHPKPGIYFVRTLAAAETRKVLLVE